MTAEEFWNWFSDRAPTIASSPNNIDIIEELDKRVALTWPDLAWEIGPDPTGGWYFALSPNLRRELLQKTKEAIRIAPEVTGWKFYSTRQRKAWDGTFKLETQNGTICLNSVSWNFVFLRYPDGERELVLVTPDATLLEPDDRWQAAAVVIEAMLGEECVLDNIDTFALEPAVDATLSALSKPVSLLPQTFGSA